MLYSINTRHRKIWEDMDNNRRFQTQVYYWEHLYFLTIYREEVLWCFIIGSFGILLFDYACHQRLCQCILLCVSMHFVSLVTLVSMHLALKIYSTSFSRFQVMMLNHLHTKVILIFKHYIAVPTKQFKQTSDSYPSIHSRVDSLALEQVFDCHGTIEMTSPWRMHDNDILLYV